MKTYTLKLKTASTTNYSLYDGTTLVSDADLTTLFATEGEAYFTIDLNSLTPTNLTSLTVVNSSDTAVMTNTGLTLVDGKNFKGEWGNSATSFTSFAQLSAYGLDESQLATLVEKIGEGKIRTVTTADYNWPTTGTPSRFDPTYIGSGIYILGEDMVIRPSSSTKNSGEMLIVSYGGGSTNSVIEVPIGMVNGILYNVDASHNWSLQGSIQPVDNLTNSDAWRPLSANQGRILNNNIGDLTTLTTTAKTSTVAAINELVTSIGNIETALNAINNGGGN